MDRFHRIFRLHGLLSSRRTPLQLSSIMQKLECSKATAQRCIADMRTYLDAPLEYDRTRNGYYYNQTSSETPFQLPGLWFSAEELNGLLICREILNDISPGILNDHINALQHKINKLLCSQHGAKTEMTGRIKTLTIARRLKDDLQFKKVASALFSQQAIIITYIPRGSSYQPGQRTVSPQQLIYYRDNWYLLAWCHNRKVLRIYAVDNIKTCESIAESYTSLPHDEIDQFISASYGIFSGPAQHTAEIRFNSKRARWIADEIWHPQQHGEWLTDGSYQLSLPFSDSRELIMDILKYGPDVIVTKPQFLVDEIKQCINAMQKNYHNLTE